MCQDAHQIESQSLSTNTHQMPTILIKVQSSVCSWPCPWRCASGEWWPFLTNCFIKTELCSCWDVRSKRKQLVRGKLLCTRVHWLDRKWLLIIILDLFIIQWRIRLIKFAYLQNCLIMENKARYHFSNNHSKGKSIYRNKIESMLPMHPRKQRWLGILATFFQSVLDQWRLEWTRMLTGIAE